MTQEEKDSLLLEALRQVGVDNWEGWDDALGLYNQWLSEEDFKVENPHLINGVL